MSPSTSSSRPSLFERPEVVGICPGQLGKIARGIFPFDSLHECRARGNIGRRRPSSSRYVAPPAWSKCRWVRITQSISSGATPLAARFRASGTPSSRCVSLPLLGRRFAAVARVDQSQRIRECGPERSSCRAECGSAHRAATLCSHITRGTTPNMLPPSIHNRPPLTKASWMSPMEMDEFIDSVSRSTSIATALPPPRHSAAMPTSASAGARVRAEQRHKHPCPAGANRVAKCDCAAVNVYALRRQLELPHAREHLHGKRFVDFEQIDIIERAAGFGNNAADGFHGRGEQVLRLGAGSGCRDDSRKWPPARIACGGRFRTDNDRRGAVADHATNCPRSPCRLPEMPAQASPVPPNPYRRAGLHRARRCLHRIHGRTATGTISAGKCPGFGGRDGPAMTFERDTDPARRAKCRPAPASPSAISPIDCLLNGQVSPSCIMRIDKRAVAQRRRVARQYPAGLAHAFHSARDDQIDIAAAHALRREHHGFQSRAAHFVDRQCRDRRRQAGSQCRLPRRRLPNAGREHVAQDNFVDVRRFARRPEPRPRAPRRRRGRCRQRTRVTVETCRSACGTRKVSMRPACS